MRSLIACFVLLAGLCVAGSAGAVPGNGKAKGHVKQEAAEPVDVQVFDAVAAVAGASVVASPDMVTYTVPGLPADTAYQSSFRFVNETLAARQDTQTTCNVGSNGYWSDDTGTYSQTYSLFKLIRCIAVDPGDVITVSAWLRPDGSTAWADGPVDGSFAESSFVFDPTAGTLGFFDG